MFHSQSNIPISCVYCKKVIANPNNWKGHFSKCKATTDQLGLKPPKDSPNDFGQPIKCDICHTGYYSKDPQTIHYSYCLPLRQQELQKTSPIAPTEVIATVSPPSVTAPARPLLPTGHVTIGQSFAAATTGGSYAPTSAVQQEAAAPPPSGEPVVVVKKSKSAVAAASSVLAPSAAVTFNPTPEPPAHRPSVPLKAETAAGGKELLRKAVEEVSLQAAASSALPPARQPTQAAASPALPPAPQPTQAAASPALPPAPQPTTLPVTLSPPADPTLPAILVPISRPPSPVSQVSSLGAIATNSSKPRDPYTTDPPSASPSGVSLPERFQASSMLSEPVPTPPMRFNQASSAASASPVNASRNKLGYPGTANPGASAATSSSATTSICGYCGQTFAGSPISHIEACAKAKEVGNILVWHDVNGRMTEEPIKAWVGIGTCSRVTPGAKVQCKMRIYAQARGQAEHDKKYHPNEYAAVAKQQASQPLPTAGPPSLPSSQPRITWPSPQPVNFPPTYISWLCPACNNPIMCRASNPDEDGIMHMQQCAELLKQVATMRASSQLSQPLPAYRFPSMQAVPPPPLRHQVASPVAGYMMCSKCQQYFFVGQDKEFQQHRCSP